MPKVSAVVPTYNNQATIQQCLTSLRFNGVDEVIVVDGGSRDDTLTLVSRFDGINIVGRNVRPIAKAREIGWRAANNEFILFLDADAHIQQNNSVEQLLSHFTKQIAGVCCRVTCANPNKLLPRLRDIDFRLSYPGEFKRLGKIPCASETVLCGLFRRKVLEDVEGFTPTLSYAEDLLLLWKLNAAGYTVLTVYDPPALHYHRENLRAVCLQFYHYGEGHRMLAKVTNAKFYSRQAPPKLARTIVRSLEEIHQGRSADLLAYPFYKAIAEISFLTGFVAESAQSSVPSERGI